jgi:hypothetical protein
MAAAALLAASMPVPAQAPDIRFNVGAALRGIPSDKRSTEPGERLRLLDEGEIRLAAGDAAGAREAFERASQMLHAADTEMALVRALMQAGEYRRALAFCAHAASAHRDVPAAGALYAWLLRAGGQEAFARRVLDETLARAPTDAVANAAQRAFEAESPQASGLLLELPQRMAPQAWMLEGQPPPRSGMVVSSAVLMSDGRHALAPFSGIESAGRLWVRDGLGRTTEAALDSVPDLIRGLGFVLLRLAAPLSAETASPASRDPFAGSPGFSIEFAAANDSSPAWPWLRQGFFGGFDGATGMRKLGIDVPAGPHGGPVFDAAGRLAGIAVPGEGGRPSMLPVSMFRAVARGSPDVEPAVSAVAPATPARLPPDEVYERALQVVLQVIVER